MTSTQTNAAAVTDLYAAFGRGDVPAILDRLADDVRWDDHHSGRVAHLTPRRGPAEVADFFAIIARWRPLAFDVLDVIGTGRQVVAEVRVEFELPDGRRLADEELHLWTFDDTGRVSRFRHYCDTAGHAAATS